jgi:hypothetical protein
MMLATYNKVLRANAKRDRKYIVTVEFICPNGKLELGSQGLMSKAEAKTIADAWVKVITGRVEKKLAKVR